MTALQRQPDPGHSLPEGRDLEALIHRAWHCPDSGITYRVEAVARGRGSLSGAPVVFYSPLEKPAGILAMRLAEWPGNMQPQPLV